MVNFKLPHKFKRFNTSDQLTLVNCLLFIQRSVSTESNDATRSEHNGRERVAIHMKNMNGYPKEIFNNHVKKFLSEKLMTTNSCQNMNTIPFIGHPSITFKK